MILKLLLITLIGGFLIGTVYFRYVTVPAKHFAERAVATETGVVTSFGGHRVTIPALSEDELATLLDLIQATPRTHEIENHLPDTRIFVHRSLAWGFPDVTHVMLTQDTLTLDGHLVYGRSDLGVNKARIDGWLNGLQG
ncbi:MAG: DUF1499 domain-containing protein [Planktomarina sp.]